MLGYVLRRMLVMIPTVFIISIVSFALIKLPPGDFLTSYVASLEAGGESVDDATLAALEQRYGLNQPGYVQYRKWISGIVLRGDFGQSFELNAPVSSLIWGRLGLTLMLSITTLLFTWAVAFPDRHLHGGQKVLAGRLRLHPARLHRSGHSQFSAGADPDVRRLQIL